MKVKVRRTIGTRISIFVAVCIIIINVVSLLCNGRVIQNILTNDSREILQAEAENNAGRMNEWLEKQADILITMQESLAYKDDLDHEEIMDYLEQQLGQNEDALMYYVCFAYDKSILPADHSELDLDPTTRVWWKEAVETGGLIYTEPYVDFVTGQMVVSIASPFEIEEEQAVILADITIDKLVEIVGNISNDESTQAFLLAADGSVVTHENEAYLPAEEGNTILTDQVNLNLDAKEVTTFTDYDGQKKYAAVSTIEATGWKVGVTKNLQVIQQQIQDELGSSILLSNILMIVSIILLAFFVRRMLKPVNHMVETVVNISEGEFSVQVQEGRRKDEIGVLQTAVSSLVKTLSQIIGDANYILGEMAAYNLATDNMKEYQGDFNELSASVNSIKAILNRLLIEIQESASGVECGSSQLAAAAEALADGTTAQAASIQELEGEVSDVTERISRNSENCTVVNQKLANLDMQIQTGNSQMQELVHTVEDVEEMSADIQKIVGAIESIAFQTNILALNASVEAARAGENGKGFAVVAEEVGNLAFKCAEESKKTAQLVESCIASITKVKTAADSTSACLETIVTDSADIARTFDAISADTAEQAQSSNNIREEICKISDVVQSNTATAEETAASSEELSQQAQNLKGLVQRFKVEQ